MGLAKKVRILLIERGMTQVKLAAKLGITPATLNDKLVRDNLSERDLVKIADALDCDFDACFVLRDTGKRI